MGLGGSPILTHKHKTQLMMEFQEQRVSVPGFRRDVHPDGVVGCARVVLVRARGDVPALFATLDRLGGAAITRVELTDQWNAGCVTRGLLRASMLRLGLPLMQHLPVADCEAIMAHELAHASSMASKGWRALGGVLQGLRWIEGSGDAKRRRSFGGAWRASVRRVRRPIECAWFALSRSCEFSADAEAARLVGAPVMAAALVRMALVDHDDASRDAGRCLEDLMAEPPRTFDTHPGLAARLAALGVTAELPPIREDGREPGTVLLGDALARVAPMLGVVPKLQSASRHDLSLSKCVEDDLETALTAAKQIWQRDGAASAAARLQQIVTRHGADARADFLLGRAFIACNDPLGVLYIERAMAADATARSPGAELLSVAAREAGDAAKADAWQQASVDALAAFLAACRTERSLAVDMTLLAHRLDLEAINGIAAAANHAGWIARSYAVRRPVREWLLQPGLHIVVVSRDQVSMRNDDNDDDAAILLRRAIETAIGNALFVLTVAGAADAPLLAALERMPAARVHSADRA